MAKASTNQTSVDAAKRELKKLFADPNPTDLQWNYDVGKLVEFIHPVKTGRAYGSSTIQSLAEFLQPDGPKSLPSNLMQARKFAKLYKPAEVKALTRLKDATGHPLGWQHLMPLLSVEDAQKREKLLDRCLAKCWSVRQLQLELQLARKGGKRTWGGRRPSVPKSLPFLLADLNRLGERWLRWGDELGLIEDHTQCEPSAEQLDPEVRFTFVAVRKQMEVFLQAVKKQADRRGTRKPRPVPPTSKKTARRRKELIEDRWGR